MEPSSRRRAARRIVLAMLAIVICGVLGLAGTGLRRFDALRARVDEASSASSHDASTWAPGEAFTFDLDPPREAQQCWIHELAEARDERLPAPPEELVAWLEAHAAEVDELEDRVRATGPLRLPDLGNNVVSRNDPSRHVWAAGRANSLLVASAGVAAFQGRHDIADRRLDAAWTLTISLTRLGWQGGVGNHVLGTLRVVPLVHAADARTWLSRLDAIDQRGESGDMLVASARETVRSVEGWADRSVPAWLPGPLRRVAVRVAVIPPAWAQCPGAIAKLDARDALLTQDGCADPVALIAPSWTRELSLPDWMPTSQRARKDDALAMASRRMGDLNLTRQVLAARAGLAGDEPCGGPLVRMMRGTDGRLTLAVDSPPDGMGATPLWLDGATSFTFDAPRISTPVMASAPGR